MRLSRYRTGQIEQEGGEGPFPGKRERAMGGVAAAEDSKRALGLHMSYRA